MSGTQTVGTHARATAHLTPTQFKPGQSGNPAGRPKHAQTALEVAKKYAAPAMHKLAEMAGLVPGCEPALFESTRLAACKEILDRALGKAPQALVGNPDQPVVVRFQWQSATEGVNNSAEQPSGPTIDGQPTLTIEWSEQNEQSDALPEQAAPDGV